MPKYDDWRDIGPAAASASSTNEESDLQETAE